MEQEKKRSLFLHRGAQTGTAGPSPTSTISVIEETTLDKELGKKSPSAFLEQKCILQTDKATKLVIILLTQQIYRLMVHALATES